MIRATSIFAAIIALGSSSPAIAADPTVGDIVAALERHSRTLESGRVEWTEKTVDAAGSRTQPGKTAFPTDDTETNFARVLVWDGKRMSYRYKGKTPAADQGGYVPMTYASAVDGRGKSQALWIDESGQYRGGTLANAEALEYAQGIDLIPILLWLQPSAKLSFGISADYKILPDRRRIEGRDCLVLAKDRGERVDLLFVDTEHDSSIVRYEVQVEKKPKVRIDVLYAKDPKARWVPASWQTAVLAPDGRVRSVHNGSVTTCQIGIKPEAKLFELEFPPGTWVNDNIDRKQYVIRLDGTKRIVTPEDLKRGKSYQDFLKPD